MEYNYQEKKVVIVLYEKVEEVRSRILLHSQEKSLYNEGQIF